MKRKSERDLVPSPQEGGRRMFMIAGETVILRALEASDLDRCYRWMNDPVIVRTLKSRYPIAFDHEVECREGTLHDILILSVFRDEESRKA